MNAINRFKTERQRQIEQEGYDPSHDDLLHPLESVLEKAARAYHMASMTDDYLDKVPMIWPFEHQAWKPSEDPIRNLEKAGALLIAAKEQCLRKAEDLENQRKNLEEHLQLLLDDE
jgi:hypothetical protein